MTEDANIKKEKPIWISPQHTLHVSIYTYSISCLFVPQRREEITGGEREKAEVLRAEKGGGSEGIRAGGIFSSLEKERSMEKNICMTWAGFLSHYGKSSIKPPFRPFIGLFFFWLYI